MQTVLADFHHYLTNQTQYADENEQQVVIRIWGRLFYIIYGEQQLQEFNLIGSNILFTFTQRLNRNILYIVFQAMNDHLKSQLDENNEEALTNNVKCNIQFLCQKAMADGVINIRHLRIALYLMNSLKILFILTQQDDAFKEINEQYKQTITTFYVAVANEVVDQLAVIADNIKQGQLLPELMLEIQSLCAKRGTDYDEFFQVSKRERIKILADMKNSQEFVLLAKEAMLSFEDQFNALFVLWDSQGRMPGEQAEKLKLLEQCMDLLIDIANFDNNGDVLLPQPPTTTFFIWRRTHELVVRSFAEAPDYISFFNTARMNSWDKTINDSDSSCESTDQDEPIISQVTHS
jgi:hypothetical protein